MTNLKAPQDNQFPLSGSTDKPENERFELGARLKEVRKARNVSRNEAAAAVGVSVSTMQAWEAGEREPDATKLSSFVRHYGVRADWLLFGDGGMFKPAAPTQAESPRSEVDCPCLDTLGNPVNLQDFVFIPRYNLKASAGHGLDANGEKPIFSMAFRRYWIDNFLRIDPHDLSVLSVKGDSMEGVLNDRDVILVNHADNTPKDGLYVLRIDGDLVVKRVQRLPAGKLAIISANEAYITFDIDPNDLSQDFAIIGRVVWFGRQL
ncbi:helix-turn-helix transcriptional regulator [Laribacter hongkongensis]|uniref:XRE family transcriptional regulator n=1 Tax=Laribacter hongkongensis TaxID=168471 RepID=UPI0018776FAD|nr:helix-turn-helix transcriptional regulator [Laribacter hongkongensis]MCG9059443.1 helix-turn-helix transcriptional regulator [Laribacter hongkongensis]